MNKLTTSTISRFTVLDSFRGIFALCVVVFHTHYFNSITETSFFRGSDSFVDFFFVLSGFVITHSYAYKKDISFKKFTLSRFFRLFPLHIATLIFYILLELCKLVAYRYGIAFNKPPFSAENDPSQIIPNLLLLQSWTTYTNALSFNYPAWSISIEFYIYLIFFITLLVKGLYRNILWFFIASIATLLFSNSYLTTADILSITVLRGLSGFFAGALTYLLYKNTHNIIKLGTIGSSLFEISLFISILFVISSNFDNKGIVLLFLFSASIFIFAFEKGLLSSLFSQQLFNGIGKLSYSIYMTHAPILFMILSLYMILEKFLKTKSMTLMIKGFRFVDFGSIFLNNLGVLITVITVLLVSNITYKYIEIPGQRFGKKFIKKYITHE